MNLPEPGLLLAGFLLAHAAWSVSDLPKGELLVPLAMIDQGGGRKLVRFEADTQEAAIAKGKASMTQLGTLVDAWAFGRDGLFRESSGPVDAITIDFWARGMKGPASLVQRYEPFAKSGRFRVIGEPMIVVDGVALSPKDSKPYLAVIHRGIQNHSKVAPLWSSGQ